MKSLLSCCLCFAIVGLTLIIGRANAENRMAAIVVDIQGDFTTARNGSLAVPNSDEAYLESVSRATERLRKAGLPVYATQDWHPANHMSFASNNEGKKPFDTMKLPDGRNQVLWPNHCVQETAGAQILLAPELITKLIQKGADSRFDSYSGFMDDGGAATLLDKELKAANINTLIVYGIATDYCVKATVLDALKHGYNVYVVSDLCRGVAGDTSKGALEEMEQKGAKVLTSLSSSNLGF